MIMIPILPFNILSLSGSLAMGSKTKRSEKRLEQQRLIPAPLAIHGAYLRAGLAPLLQGAGLFD